MRIIPEPPALEADPAGRILVGGTRVPLESIVLAFHDGATPEEIAIKFPSLDMAAVYEALAYALRHPDKIDQYLGERGKHTSMVREACAGYSPRGIRSRLLARRKNDPLGR